MNDEQVADNRARQRELYGATLGDVFTDLTVVLQISRGRLAQALGLSAPMVSQLASGHRLKIGNPAAGHRLQRLVELADEVRAGALAPAEALERIAADDGGSVLTRTTTTPARQGAVDVQSVLRWAAGAAEIEAAAVALEAEHPRLAEVLRVYGTGRTDDAVEHFTAVRGRG